MRQYDFATMIPHEVKADLADARVMLANRINALRGHFTADAMVDRAVSAAKDAAVPAMQVVDSALRSKLVAAVLTGADLAKLTIGKAIGRRTPCTDSVDHAATARWEDKGGPPAPHPRDDALSGWPRSRPCSSGGVPPCAKSPIPRRLGPAQFLTPRMTAWT